MVEILAVIEIIDQDEGVGGIATDVEADRRAGPIDFALALDLVVERARTIAQADHEGARRLAPGNIGIGLALILEDLLDNAGQALGPLAEHAFGRADQIIFLIGFARRHRGWRRIGGDRCAGGGRPAGSGRGIIGAGIGRSRWRRQAGIDTGIGRRAVLDRRRRKIGIDRRVGIDRANLRAGDRRQQKPAECRHQGTHPCEAGARAPHAADHYPILPEARS